MRRRTLGNSKLEVSAIVVQGARLPEAVLKLSNR
jgi:hypothetical protein